MKKKNVPIAIPELEGISIEVVMMTPMLAKELLDANTANRKMKDRFVDQLIFDLANGDWHCHPARPTAKRDSEVRKVSNRLSKVVSVRFTPEEVECMTAVGRPSLSGWFRTLAWPSEQ